MRKKQDKDRINKKFVLENIVFFTITMQIENLN